MANITLEERAINPQTNSRLFALTPELRTMVWRFVLMVPHMGMNGGMSISKHENGPDEENCLTVLRVCRQVFDEAAGIFYCTTSLEFHKSASTHQTSQASSKVSGHRGSIRSAVSFSTYTTSSL